MQTWQDMFLNDLQQPAEPQTPEPIGFAENIQKGGWGGFFDRATFGIKPMIEAGMLYQATKRYQLDDYPRSEEGWQQRQDDKERIVDYLTEQAERAERGLTIGAKVGTVVFDMLPFMVEFLATGGLASLGKAGTKKSILKLARKYVSNRTARTMAGIGSTMVSAGIRTALTPQHVAEKYFENRLPQLQLDENNNVVVGDAANTPATAIYKAVGDHYIELLSEESGAGLAAMAKGVMPKGVRSSASKLMNSLRKDWIKAAPGRDTIAFAKRISEKAGFHGILEEMGEERLGDLLRATFNIDDFGTHGGNLFDRMVAAIPDGQQLLVEALAFSVPAGAKASIAVGAEAVEKRRGSKTDKDFLLSEQGAKFLIDTHPEQARKIAAAEHPSRKELSFLGDIRLSADERARMAGSLREHLKADSGTNDKQNNLFSIEAVPRGIDTSQLTDLQKQQFSALDQFVSQITVDEKGNYIYPDEQVKFAVKHMAKKYDTPEAEVFGYLYANSKRMLAGKEAQFSAGIERIADERGFAPDSPERARMYLIGASPDSFSPATLTEKQLLRNQGKFFVCTHKTEDGKTCGHAERMMTHMITHLKTKHKVKGDFRKFVDIKQERSATSVFDKGEGVDVQLVEEYLRGMPLPIQGASELSYRRMFAQATGETAQAWPIRGVRQVEDPEIAHGMVEDVFFELALRDVDVRNDKVVSINEPVEIKYQGDTLTIPSSKFSRQDKARIQEMLTEANRQNIDAFAYVYNNFLKDYENPEAIAEMWESARKLLHNAAFNLWKMRHDEDSKKGGLKRGPKDAMIYKNKSGTRYEARVNDKTTNKVKQIGSFRTKNEAIEARRQWIIDHYGDDLLGYNLAQMPQLEAFPDYINQLKYAQQKPMAPRMIIHGAARAQSGDREQLLLKKMGKSSLAGQQTLDFRPGEGHDVTGNTELIVSNVGETEYEKHKDAKWQIAGRTFVDRDSGRITHEIYTEGTGRARVVAEEGYHPIVEALRIASPKDFRRVERWHAQRPQQSGQDPVEDFTKLLAQVETGQIKSKREKIELGDIYDIAQRARNIFSGKEALTPEVIENVKEVLPKGRSGVGYEGEYSVEAKAKPAFAAEPAETEKGKKLLKRLETGSRRRGIKSAGPRSIVEFVNDLVHAKMLVAKSQTTGRHPAHFEIMPHIIRTRSGIWQLNFHEAGHGLSHLLADSHPGWKKSMHKKLIELTQLPGSMASAKSAEEGMAELVRRFIVDYTSLPASVLSEFQETLNTIAPDILAGLRDAHRAYTQWRSLPVLDQLRTIQADQPPALDKRQAIEQLAFKSLYSVIGGSSLIDRMVRDAYFGIAGGGTLARADMTGITSLIKAKFNKAYRAQLQLARDFRELIKDTPSDIESAYQSTLHTMQEVQRAVYGVRGGREGIRVPSTGKGFNSLAESEIKILREGGFELPDSGTEHGEWIYLSDKSISKIKHEIGLDKWQNFTLYGQYRAALERYKKKGHDYPGRLDGLTPELLQQWLAEQEKENPGWTDHFDQIQHYMNQLLLVSVLSGEYSAAEAVTIKNAWQDYWPLPRQLEDKPMQRTGSGTEPSSGIRGAHGSPLPFRTLDEALESRTKMALEAYHTNRLMLALRNFNRTLGNYRAAAFDIRKEALRIMLPLKLEAEKVATLTDLEQGQIIADYINDQLANRMNISVQELKANGQAVDTEDIEISTPGRPVWRMGKPKAVHIIAPFEKGQRKYYQLTDPLLFDLLSKGKNPSKYFNWLAHTMTGMIAPWRRALTQNIGFALANTLSRDPANAGFMGKDGWKSLIPYFYAGTALINRLKSKGINTDAMSQSELLSKALDHTAKDAHQGIAGSFKEMLKEGILIQDWHELNAADKLSEVSGQLMSVIMKPIDIFNWVSGGRWISQLGEELPREGAFVAAQKRGDSPERAQMQYDYITGNFGQKGGSPAIAAAVRSAGFLNPGLQIMGGQLSRALDPDPKVRAFNMAAKLPALITWGAIGAAINYLLIHAVHPDDDERQAVLEQMRERPDENRLGYMAIAGKLRLPFDYGLIGASVSYGWNSVEQWLLDEPLTAKKKAEVLLRRARDLPGITDIINPYVKTGAELWLNHSFFYDDEIVPAWMEAAYPYNPELRTWPTMPKVYQTIGTGLKVSPIKVKYAVNQLFTRQMDDAVKLTDKLSGGKPYTEAADLPVIGRVMDRQAIGFQSQSVKSVSDLDAQWQALNNRVQDLEKARKDTATLKDQLSELAMAHHVMLEVNRLWKQAKDERTHENADYSQIEKLKRQMTRAARIYMKWHDQRQGKLPASIFSDDTLGDIIYRMTDPADLKKKKAETDEAFEDRLGQRTESIRQAKAIIEQLDLSRSDLKNLLRQEAARRHSSNRLPITWANGQRTDYGRRLLKVSSLKF